MWPGIELWSPEPLVNILTIIYICVNVCVCPTPPLQFWNSITGLNSEFFFSQSGCHTKVKEPSLHYNFLKGIGTKGNKNSLTQDLNLGHNFLSYNDNYYAISVNKGKYFLNLLDRHFNRENPLRKIFNRNTVKISDSFTNNMHSILNNHNRRLLDELNRNTGGPDEVSCNCRRKGECSLGGWCNSKNVAYQECISPVEHNNDGERVYKGISAGNWKQGLYNHRHSFFNPRLRNYIYIYIWILFKMYQDWSCIYQDINEKEWNISFLQNNSFGIEQTHSSEFFISQSTSEIPFYIEWSFTLLFLLMSSIF